MIQTLTPIEGANHCLICDVLGQGHSGRPRRALSHPVMPISAS
jgi:hypothetical protein